MDIWDREVHGNFQWILQQKLKAVVKGLSKWSKESIGDVFTNGKQMENDIRELELTYESNNSDSNRQALHKAQAEYTKWIKMQEDILKPKARITWA